MKNIVLLFIIIILGITACIQPPDYPIEPEIEFVSVSQSELLQNIDTVWITFSYTDGDGDIGFEDDNTNNIIITDSRDGFEQTFRVPEVPQQGASNGISGEITLQVLPSCCLNSSPICQPTPGLSPDEMFYSIQMFDRAGHFSNSVQTSPIFWICD